MKKLLLLFFILLSINIYAGKSVTSTTKGSAAVVAEPSVSFMDKTLYFSHWEVLLYSTQWDGYTAHFYSTTLTLNLEPGLKYLANNKGAPIVFAVYYPKGKHLTQHTLFSADHLSLQDEYVIISTETVQNPYSKNLIQPQVFVQCPGGVVKYNIYNSENPSVSVSKTTQNGVISFNGALNKKQELPSKKPQTPKFSPKEEPRLTPIEADNSQKQANPYMSAKREGTFLSYQESDQNLNSSSKTVPVPIDIDAFNQKQGFEPTDIRVLQKEAQDYAMAMCQFEIPQWTKGVPTLEQLKSLKK